FCQRANTKCAWRATAFRRPYFAIEEPRSTLSEWSLSGQASASSYLPTWDTVYSHLRPFSWFHALFSPEVFVGIRSVRPFRVECCQRLYTMPWIGYLYTSS